MLGLEVDDVVCHSPDLINNSPDYLPYNSYDVAMQFREFNIGSIYYPLIYIFVSLITNCLLDIVRRGSILVTHGG